MAQNIGKDAVDGIVTQIPQLADEANIVEAFMLYHYGQSTVPDSLANVPGNSVEGVIRDIKAQITQVEAGIQSVHALEPNDDLNDVTASGIYYQAAIPSTDNNYPEARAGLITVVDTGIGGVLGTVYQTYQTVSGTAQGGVNNLWWRNRSAIVGDWSSWKQAANAIHEHPQYLTTAVAETTYSPIGHNHNSLYYTQDQVNSLIAGIEGGTGGAGYTTTEIDAFLAQKASLSGASFTGSVSVSGSLSATNVSGNGSGINSLNASNISSGTLSVARGGTGASTASGARSNIGIYVQSSQPSGASSGDLWFW